MVVQRIAGEENHPNRSAVCLEITRVAGNQSEKLRIKPLHPGDVPHENPDMAEMNGWSRTHRASISTTSNRSHPPWHCSRHRWDGDGRRNHRQPAISSDLSDHG